MSEIITVTLNTAIDLFYEVPDLNIGKSLRANYFKRFASGKGVNVSRTLDTLNQKSIALGIIGSSSSLLFSKLKTSNIHPEFIEIDGETRTNTTITSKNSASLIHVQSEGFCVNDTQISEIKSRIKSRSVDGKIIVFSGSLPIGAAIETYEELILFCKELGAFVVLDSSGFPLDCGIKAKPDMIKPNVDELERHIGHSLKSKQEIINTIKLICSRGISNVFVSMGKSGIMACGQGDPFIYQGKASIDGQSRLFGNVGSGDAFIGGGVLSGFSNKSDFIESIKFGLACGAANLLSLGPGVCEYSDIQNFYSKATVTKRNK